MIVDIKSYLDLSSKFYKSVKNGVNQDTIAQSSNKDERMEFSEEEKSKKKLEIMTRPKEKEKKEESKKSFQPNEDKKSNNTDKVKKILNIL